MERSTHEPYSLFLFVLTLYSSPSFLLFLSLLTLPTFFSLAFQAETDPPRPLSQWLPTFPPR